MPQAMGPAVLHGCMEDKTMAQGYVCLWRSAIESEFFDDEWLCKLWLWCLCRANFKEQEWKGETIPAGSFITGRHSASGALRVTESKFYRGLKRLENMRMVVTKSNNKFTIVTLCNWATYQQPQSDDRTANEQPANNQRTTSEQPANTGEEGKNEIRKEGNKGTRKAKRFIKPTVEEVRAYCLERNNGINPQAFVDKYESIGWVVGKNQAPMKNWKLAVHTWEQNQQSKTTESSQASCQPLSADKLQGWSLKT